MTKTFRPGPLGSLFDVYEDALHLFIAKLESVSQADYERIVRPNAKDPDCQSIQKMMNHVVGAGYAYANYVRTVWHMEITPRPDIGLTSQQEAADWMRRMFQYSLETFDGKWSMTDDDMSAVTMQTRWGPIIDIELLFEHAICHLYRHARMMEMYQQE